VDKDLTHAFVPGGQKCTISNESLLVASCCKGVIQAFVVLDPKDAFMKKLGLLPDTVLQLVKPWTHHQAPSETKPHCLESKQHTLPDLSPLNIHTHLLRTSPCRTSIPLLKISPHHMSSAYINTAIHSPQSKSWKLMSPVTSNSSLHQYSRTSP
jgi:hypothetical protein